MTRKPVTLPDLEDDADFRRKLLPLVNSALPEERKTAFLDSRHSGNTGDNTIGALDSRSYGHPDTQNSGKPDIHKDKHFIIRTNRRVSAAEDQAKIEALRGKKRRFEYLIPERVGLALAEDAASQGKSATTRLLEVLRDAGYPVIQEDLLDLRKMPKR